MTGVNKITILSSLSNESLC